MQVGARLVLRAQPHEPLEVRRPCHPAERDEREVVPAEAGAHQVVEGERGPLHGQPPALHRHGERHVHEEGDRRTGACLRLLDLDVVDPDAHSPAGIAAVGGRAHDRVAHGPAHVPRLRVPELPGPGRPGLLAGDPGHPCVPLTGPPRQAGGRIAQEGLPQAAQRRRRQTQVAVRGTPQVSGVAHPLLDLSEHPRVRDGVASQVLLEAGQVQVGQGGARVGLTQLMGEAVELCDVLHDPGALAQTQRFVPAEGLPAAPVQLRPQSPQATVHPIELLLQLRRAERLLGQLGELRPLLVRHRGEHA